MSPLPSHLQVRSSRRVRWRPLEWIVAAVIALAITATVADTLAEPPAARHAAGAAPAQA
jgi:hypothetical protein